MSGSIKGSYSVFVAFILFAGCSKEKTTTEPKKDIVQTDLKPTLTTSEVEFKPFEGAYGGGSLISVGGAGVTELGVCWDTLPLPVKAQFNTSRVVPADGEFKVGIHLQYCLKKYYVRSFATNDYGTAYGNQVDITIPDYSKVMVGNRYKIYAWTDSVPVCVTDDIITFEESGSLKIENGSLRCSGSEPEITYGTWSNPPNGPFKMTWLGKEKEFFAQKNDGRVLSLIVQYHMPHYHVKYYLFKKI